MIKTGVSEKETIPTEKEIKTMKKFEAQFSVVAMYFKTDGARDNNYFYIGGQFPNLADAMAYAQGKAVNDPSLGFADDYALPDHIFCITPIGQEEIDPEKYEELRCYAKDIFLYEGDE